MQETAMLPAYRRPLGAETQSCHLQKPAEKIGEGRAWSGLIAGSIATLLILIVLVLAATGQS